MDSNNLISPTSSSMFSLMFFLGSMWVSNFTLNWSNLLLIISMRSSCGVFLNVCFSNSSSMRLLMFAWFIAVYLST